MLCPMMGNVFYKLKESRYAEQAFGFAVLIGVGVLAYRSVNWSFLQALDFTVIYTYRVALLKGLGITLVLTSGSVIVGFVTGITLAILYQVPVAPLAIGCPNPGKDRCNCRGSGSSGGVAKGLSSHCLRSR